MLSEDGAFESRWLESLSFPWRDGNRERRGLKPVRDLCRAAYDDRRLVSLAV